jgi:SAM-dependent methyltransferase
VKCRHCATELTRRILDLGTAPASNAYLGVEALDAPEVYFPLRLMLCEACWLVQTEDFAGREALFTADYAYFSGFSTSWLEHAKRYVAAMIARFGLGARSTVAEVAANDGYLLQYVRDAGIPCYGIEPTASTAAAARRRGIEIVERFFGACLAKELADEGRQADLIAANNVLAHVPDINDFVHGVARLLKANGVATFEFPHLCELMANTQFDTVYHEHYSYLSLTTVVRIFAASGLGVFDVERLPTHGGSLRVFAQRSGGPHAQTPAVAALLDDERTLGVATTDYYGPLQAAAERVKDDLVRFLIEARRDGLKVAAYGAAAKGNTLMNFAGVRADLVRFVVDRNPAKAGRFMPGSRIPIVGEERLREGRPDIILILPWNIRDEVIAQLAYARDWGARFAVAVPRLQLT